MQQNRQHLTPEPGEKWRPMLCIVPWNLAIAGAAVGALALSRGRLTGAAEKLFPKAAALLGETVEKEAHFSDG